VSGGENKKRLGVGGGRSQASDVSKQMDCPRTNLWEEEEGKKRGTLGVPIERQEQKKDGGDTQSLELGLLS